MSNNVTKLLSNTLALNKVEYEEPSYKDGFPTWVKPGDRRLLQASSPASKANVVVAKDGSGKYTTVSEAVNAAPKSNSGRYVIYVKGGIYDEQVAICMCRKPFYFNFYLNRIRISFLHWLK